MSQITRDTFIDQLGRQGGIDVTTLDARAEAALQNADIDGATLSALGGADQTISTDAELGRLFDLIDRVDHDGHRRSIETRAEGQRMSTTTVTMSGAAYEALKEQLDVARATGGAQAKQADLTQVPSPADCALSLTAIAAAGFTNVRLSPTPYFNQADPHWGAHAYPNSPPDPGVLRTLRQAGCAPCSLAMIDCALRGARTQPGATGDFAVANGTSGRPGGGGTDTGALARTWAKAHGLSFDAATSPDQAKNVDALKAGLEADGLALVSVGADTRVGRGHFTDTSHVIVVNGCATRNGEEWFSVVNPGRADQSAGKHGLLGVDENVVQVAGARNGIGSVWISRTQLEAEMHRCFILGAAGVA